ncbi:MAG TPA: glycosyltransferase family 9 protein [Chloroflexota bacterium]|jgi:heptosyltransferase-3|nr:glycosyltransferase family 9 protein [Chloroflexota bacterium]
MERFTDQPLRPRPHLAVVFYDSIGDFVVSTPLLRGLRQKYPGCTIDYLSGERTAELEAASPLIDSRYSLFGRPDGLAALPAYVAARVRAAGPYDLAINCEAHPAARLALHLLQPRYVVGPAYTADLRGDLPYPPTRVDALHGEVWNAADLLERYGDVLQSQYIGEILCRLARVETDYWRPEVPEEPPPFATPPVLIATGANRSAKLWPAAYWREVLAWCAGRGLAVGLLGSAPAEQARYYHSVSLESALLAETPLIDLRGRLTLPQVAGALRRAQLCVTIDNGIMHLAAAVGTPTIAIFGASPHRLWAPRAPRVTVLLPPEPCGLCEENRFRNAACLLPEHRCMLSQRPERVIAAMAAALSRVPAPPCNRAGDGLE